MRHPIRHTHTFDVTVANIYREVVKFEETLFIFQDILENDEIQLDSNFKYSLAMDLVQVNCFPNDFSLKKIDTGAHLMRSK